MSLEEAVSRVAQELERQDFVEVYAHHDADGIAAGSILCSALFRRGIRFRLRILDHISLRPSLPGSRPCFVISDQDSKTFLKV